MERLHYTANRTNSLLAVYAMANVTSEKVRRRIMRSTYSSQRQGQVHLRHLI